MENEGSVLLWVCMKLQAERVSTSVYEARDSELGFGWQRFRIVMRVGFVFFVFLFFSVFFFSVWVWGVGLEIDGFNLLMLKFWWRNSEKMWSMQKRLMKECDLILPVKEWAQSRSKSCWAFQVWKFWWRNKKKMPWREEEEEPHGQRNECYLTRTGFVRN